MAARLGKLCGNGAGLWLRMQQARDLWRVERDMAAELEKIPTLRAAKRAATAARLTGSASASGLRPS